MKLTPEGHGKKAERVDNELSVTKWYNSEIFWSIILNIPKKLTTSSQKVINSSGQQKQWSSGRALDSQMEGGGFDPCPMVDGSVVKAMPGLIFVPNSDTL